MSSFCQLWLTCADEAEADKIAKVLLKKQLVACVRKMPIKSSYLWQGKIESSEEILLMMESRKDLFNEIEREVTKLHSYKTFVLESVSVSKVSKKAEAWLKKELKDG